MDPQCYAHPKKRALRDWWVLQWWNPRPAPWAWLAWPLALLYRGLSAWVQRQGRSHALPCATPTVVVGNWVVGGAGKTPTTLALLDRLRAAGWTPGVISRGYGGSVRASDVPYLLDPSRSSGLHLASDSAQHAAQMGDEPLLVALRANVPVCVHPARARARDHLLAHCPAVDIVVADDGLQHAALSRSVDIVVVDERGVGNGQLLPLGPLRQPVPRHLDAQTLVVFSAGIPSVPVYGYRAQRGLGPPQRWADWRRGSRSRAGDGWSALRDAVAAAHATTTSARPPDTPSLPTVVAVAGIAVPQRFFDLLGAQISGWTPCPLPDHFDYARAPWSNATRVVIATEKDAVKLEPWAQPDQNLGPDLWVVPLDFVLPVAFWHALDERLSVARRSHHRPLAEAPSSTL